MATPFGERLKALRKAAGMTQEALARAAGLSTNTVAKLEHVEGMDPSWSTVQKLARALGAPYEAMADEGDAADTEKPATKKPRGKGK